MADKNQAPNMYIGYNITGNSFDLIAVDFYCETDAASTYWAVHNWTGGYAGFQTKNNKHIVISAIWDDGTSEAEVEYYTANADDTHFDFEEDGPGVHVLTNINWSVSTWYGMCMETKSFGGITFFAQWVYSSGKWNLISIIRIPGAGRTFNTTSVFQEDFYPFNRGDKRKCRIKHARGRSASNGTWEFWNAGTISNRYYPNDDNTGYIDNYSGYCSWGTDSSSGEAFVWVEAGGNSTPPAWGSLPVVFSISSNAPNSFPEFPKCIKSYYSDLYISFSGTNVIQKSDRCWWIFELSNDGYYYILTPDRANAITISGTNNGDNLILTSFTTGNDNQKWYIETTGSGVSYLNPKNAIAKCMDIEGPSTSPDAAIQIWTQNSTTPQFKWILL